MATYSVFRLFFRLEKPGRLPLYGNVGITHMTSFLDRQHLALQTRNEESKRIGMMGITCTASRFKLPAFRRYSTAVSTTDVTKSDAARLAPKKKGKTVESPKIILICETKQMSVVTLEEAGKIAERKGLHLVLEQKDNQLSKDKSVYKLLTNVEFLGSSEPELDSPTNKDFRGDKGEKKKEKEFKTVILKSKIAENDIISKVKQMVKWIEKGYSIRLMIGQTGEKGDADHVYKLIEENMKESGARFLQKISKGDNIRVQIAPPKKEPTPKTKKVDNVEHDSS